MTPRPVDVASVQAKLRSLDELGSALRLVGEVDGARLEQDVLLRLAVERALTQAVDLIVAVCSHVVHEYARADLSIVATAVPVAQRDLADFVRQVASWLQRRG